MDLARKVRDLQAQQRESAPLRSPVDLRLWTPERAVLTDLGDILLGVLAELQTQVTGKRQRPSRMPRPVLARDRLEAADAFARHRERVRLMLPNRARRE